MGTIEEALVNKIYEFGLETIDGAVTEFKYTYKERTPFVTVPLITGPCTIWNPDFITLVQLAMSTDKLIDMNTDELDIWYNFVNFEDYHSTSAREEDANGTAVGCTIPDANNHSFVVGKDNVVTTELCQPPSYEVQNEVLWKSLDRVLMSIYECSDIEDCGRNDTMEDISPCPVAHN